MPPTKVTPMIAAKPAMIAPRRRFAPALTDPEPTDFVIANILTEMIDTDLTVLR
jgi:hypothetical protein